MKPDKPVHADNVPTPSPRQQFPSEQVKPKSDKLKNEGSASAKNDAAARLEAESRLQAEQEARPVSGTPSRPYVDEPGKQLGTRTKVQDPAEAAVQTRSATDAKARENKHELRNQ